MIVVSLLFGAAVLGLSYLLPNLYRSQALIVVNAAGTELPLSEPDMETWRDLLLSRNMVARVLEKAGKSDQPIEHVEGRMQALLTKRTSRDVPYARNINLTFDAGSPEESQKVMRSWCDTAQEISNEMAQQEIQRLRDHYRTSYEAAKKENERAEAELTRFRSEMPLPEERVRLKVLQDTLADQRTEYEVAFAETRVMEQYLAMLQKGFQEYFANGGWVGDLDAGFTGTRSAAKSAPVEQMAGARKEYLTAAKKLEQLRSRKKVAPITDRLRVLTGTIGDLEKLLEEEKANADSYARAVADLEKEFAASRTRPVVEVRRAPTSETFFLSPAGQQADFLKGKGMIGEELNPHFFAVENMMAQNRDANNKAQAKVQSIERSLVSLRKEQDDLNKAVASAQQEQTALELQLLGSTQRYQDAQKVFNQIAANISSATMQLELSKIRRDASEKNIRKIEAEVREVTTLIAQGEQTERELTLRAEKSRDVLTANTQKLYYYTTLNVEKIGLLSVGSPASYPKAKVWPPRGKIAMGATILMLFGLSLGNLLRESMAKEKRNA